MPDRLGDIEASAEHRTRNHGGLTAYLHDALLAGRTQQALAREFTVSRHTIRNWLRKRGLQPVRSVHTHTTPNSRRPKGH